MPKQKPPEIAPPDHLSESSKALWHLIVPRRACSPERLALLTVALEARDRMDQARVAIAKDGMTTTTAKSSVVHLHPLLRVEKESRQLFLAAWAKLGLEFDYVTDGR